MIGNTDWWWDSAVDLRVARRGAVRSLRCRRNGRALTLGMRVVWTRPALADVLQIRDYIAADSPRYARIVAKRLFVSRPVPVLAQTCSCQSASPRNAARKSRAQTHPVDRGRAPDAEVAQGLRECFGGDRSIRRGRPRGHFDSCPDYPVTRNQSRHSFSCHSGMIGDVPGSSVQ